MGLIEDTTKAGEERPANRSSSARTPSTDALPNPGLPCLPEGVNCLSERELEVVALLATGATNQEIARKLVISANTVKVHLRNIYEKLGVQSRTEATMEAVRRGWVMVEGMAPPAEALGGATAALAAARSVTAPVAAPRPHIGNWQRMYMVAAAVLVISIGWGPEWLRSQGAAQAVSQFSDTGRTQMAMAPRAPVTRWNARAALPESRARLAVAASEGKLFAIGGETAAGVTGQVMVYDTESNGWLPGAAKPVPVANTGAAVIDGLVFVPGGTPGDGAVSSALEAYDPAADAWSTRAPMPAALSGAGVAGQDGKLYVFGGWDGAAYSAATFVYDPALDGWQTLTPMPTPAAFLAAASLDGMLYTTGGWDRGGERDDVWVFDPAAEGTGTNPWSARASLSQPRAGHAMVGLNHRLYVIGGGWQHSIDFNEQYDVSTGAWSRIESPVLGEWRNLGLAASGNYLYAVGGWSGGYLPTTEQYRTLYTVLLPMTGNQK